MMNENLDNSTSNEESGLDFEGEGEAFEYKASISRVITDEILQREKLPEMPQLGSSIIEDFIADKVKEGIVDPEVIANEFASDKNISRINEYINNIEKKTGEMDWNEVFSIDDAKEMQVKVCKEMAVIGMNEAQISEVMSTEIEISDNIGRSRRETEQLVRVNRSQAIRKALDYKTVFGEEAPLEKIIKALLVTNVGHELGHKIDAVANNASLRISRDENWEKDENTGERTNERFAEFWSTVRVDAEFAKIRGREFLIQVSKVNNLLDQIENYNAAHDNEIDLMKIFYSIREKFEQDNPKILDFLESRMCQYQMVRPENYAMPYDRETVAQAVRGE